MNIDEINEHLENESAEEENKNYEEEEIQVPPQAFVDQPEENR